MANLTDYMQDVNRNITQEEWELWSFKHPVAFEVIFGNHTDESLYNKILELRNGK